MIRAFVVGGLLGFGLAGAGAQTPQQGNASATQTKQMQTGQQQPASKTQTAMTTLGEQKFQQNCNRCHNAPQELSTRISGTVVMHMRVRASLSEADAKAILRFLAP